MKIIKISKQILLLNSCDILRLFTSATLLYTTQSLTLTCPVISASRWWRDCCPPERTLTRLTAMVTWYVSGCASLGLKYIYFQLQSAGAKPNLAVRHGHTVCIWMCERD